MDTDGNKSRIITLYFLAIIVLLVLFKCMFFDTCSLKEGCKKVCQNEDGTKRCESYTFDLSNDMFSGNQSDQEMGDYQIAFYGNVSTFSGLTLGKGVESDVWKEWLYITEEKVAVYDAENQIIVDEYIHGLNVKDFIAVNIKAYLDGTADIEIMTNGGCFKRTRVKWIGRNGRIFVEATGGNTILTDCMLSYYCNGWNKSIWLYGDSYFSTTAQDRWTYYLCRNGTSDILLSGHDGEGSAESLTAFRTQLQYGIPDMVIWCVGMNDGDSKKTINKEYKECLDEVIKLCEEKHIELILATIPTCPYWFNDHKNNYVKERGYTYIDFADSVGSYDSITWNEGMLEEADNRIHPTKQGAMALYGKAIATVPELLK